MADHAPKRINRVAGAHREIAGGDKPHIARGKCRGKKHPYIGRRRSMRCFYFLAVLMIVRRKPVVVRADKGLEKVPRAPRNQSQKFAFCLSQGLTAEIARSRTPYRNFRCDQPKYQNWYGGPKNARGVGTRQSVRKIASSEISVSLTRKAIEKNHRPPVVLI